MLTLCIQPLLTQNKTNGRRSRTLRRYHPIDTHSLFESYATQSFQALAQTLEVQIQVLVVRFPDVSLTIIIKMIVTICRDRLLVTSRKSVACRRMRRMVVTCHGKKRLGNAIEVNSPENVVARQVKNRLGNVIETSGQRMMHSGTKP